ncbi:MAG: ATP synthase F1 subunit gamma [Pseudomonadota bacterium]|nr:ATP synthase F1 subunit gamma [Pseudomonadota bacterium]MDE3037940.1 ATP synthase F1 subunit gamma [Pseudomonadota bacterium]
MPSLKDLKNRIKSVKSTQKITKAMKMVAAAKLRRAREAAENARPYAEAMERMLENLAASRRTVALKNPGTEEKKEYSFNSTVPQFNGSAIPLLSGIGEGKTHLIVVAASDRGLCGAFNTSIVRAVRRKIHELQTEGKTVKLLCVGRKGYEQLHHEFKSLIIGRLEIKTKKLGYADAETVAKDVMQRFDAEEFDVAYIVYNTFRSVIAQVVTWQRLVPLAVSGGQQSAVNSPYEAEPSEEELLAKLLPKNLAMRTYRALLENAASEQGARMTAMDNATRNAGDMIKKLNLKYNRTRQAAITKELIEIISGAEAV